jgi:hypothetical protein
MQYLVKSLSTETHIVQLENLIIEEKQYIIGRKASSIELFQLSADGDLISVLEQMLFRKCSYLGILHKSLPSNVIILLTNNAFDFLEWSSSLRRFVTTYSLPIVTSPNGQERAYTPFKFEISAE